MGGKREFSGINARRCDIGWHGVFLHGVGWDGTVFLGALDRSEYQVRRPSISPFSRCQLKRPLQQSVLHHFISSNSYQFITHPSPLSTTPPRQHNSLPPLTTHKLCTPIGSSPVNPNPPNLSFLPLKNSIYSLFGTLLPSSSQISYPVSSQTLNCSIKLPFGLTLLFPLTSFSTSSSGARRWRIR